MLSHALARSRMLSHALTSSHLPLRHCRRAASQVRVNGFEDTHVAYFTSPRLVTIAGRGVMHGGKYSVAANRYADEDAGPA